MFIDLNNQVVNILKGSFGQTYYYSEIVNTNKYIFIEYRSLHGFSIDFIRLILTPDKRIHLLSVGIRINEVIL